MHLCSLKMPTIPLASTPSRENIGWDRSNYGVHSEIQTWLQRKTQRTLRYNPPLGDLICLKHCILLVRSSSLSDLPAFCVWDQHLAECRWGRAAEMEKLEGLSMGNPSPQACRNSPRPIGWECQEPGLGPQHPEVPSQQLLQKRNTARQESLGLSTLDPKDPELLTGDPQATMRQGAPACYMSPCSEFLFQGLKPSVKGSSSHPE